jgi:hypothetical protein
MSGDTLGKSRRTDHWLYFEDKGKRKHFKRNIIAQEFSIAADLVGSHKFNFTHQFLIRQEF